MENLREIKKDIYFLGGSDERLALFENMFPLPNGVSYNAYLINDEKTCLLDTVDEAIRSDFLENLKAALKGRRLDYLVVNHMEGDHGALVKELVDMYPEMIVVGNPKTFNYIEQFFGLDLSERSLLVYDHSVLDLGKHQLTFYMTPMVHWPEVMMTYETSEGILFSADAFGSFGAHHGSIFSDENVIDEAWFAEARRYYANIVGKYGPQVLAALSKLKELDIKMIAPLHGLIWRKDLSLFINKYQSWASYEPEEKKAIIIYASMYGNTKKAADVLNSLLSEKGLHGTKVYDVSKTHLSYLIAESFRASHIILASPTYNNEIYPLLFNYLHDLKMLNLQNRTFALIENGTWGPMSGRLMKEKIQELKNCAILEPIVTIRSSLNKDSLEILKTLSYSIQYSIETK